MRHFDPLAATIYQATGNGESLAPVFRLRKKLFVDELGWSLRANALEEKDEFDTPATVHCAFFLGDDLIGGFRAIRCDHPYLAQRVFPHLAATRPYPASPEYWEISRFGVLRAYRHHGVALYAIMFQFARSRRAKALVAIADLNHERLLRRLGIRTRRYGPPAIIGADAKGEAIEVVAGEIPLTDQDDACLKPLEYLANQVEIRDETLVFGPARISA